jgi:ABC-type polysaccharide/polyol phosphate export permease
MSRGPRELIRYRDFLANLVLTELKLRYRDSFLGFLWTILNPLFFLLVLALVFSRILRVQVPNYTIFLLSGLTSWMMIQQTVLIATASIVNNQSFIKKIYVPKIAFPLANVLARYVDHLLLTLVLFGFMAAYRMPATWSLLILAPVILMHFCFSLGLSLLAAVIYIRVKDIQHILSILFQALFYATPILYSADQLPAGFRTVFRLNPFYYFVRCFRAPVYAASPPPLSEFLIALGLTAAALGAGLLVFHHFEKEMVFHLA